MLQAETGRLLGVSSGTVISAVTARLDHVIGLRNDADLASNDADLRKRPCESSERQGEESSSSHLLLTFSDNDQFKQQAAGGRGGHPCRTHNDVVEPPARKRRNLSLGRSSTGAGAATLEENRASEHKKTDEKTDGYYPFAMKFLYDLNESSLPVSGRHRYGKANAANARPANLLQDVWASLPSATLPSAIQPKQLVEATAPCSDVPDHWKGNGDIRVPLPKDSPEFEGVFKAFHRKCPEGTYEIISIEVSPASLGLTDHSQVDMLGSRYTSVNFEVGKSPNW